MPNAGDYWAERGLANAVRVYNYSQRKARLITRWFNRASKDMQRKIDGFYRDYAEGEGISPRAAKETLTNRQPLSLTLADAAKLAKRAPKDATLAKLLRQNYLQRAISREEFLKLQLQVLASELYSDTDAGINRALTETFEDSYYHGLFDFQQFTGFGSGFNRISTHQIEAAVTTGWQGKNYSERLWGEHRVSLARYLNRIVSTGIIEGRSNADMRAQLQKVMNMSAYNARRLIRTEATQISSRACAAAYEENGTPKFKFLATLDFKTSTICRDMDGRVFNTKDAKVGVNMPPLHPFCRSTTVPYIPDTQFDEGATRAARGGDGGTYKVPADMTYKDWHKKYVESNPAELLAEQKQRNGRDDAKQFAEYKARLGASAPKAFDDFQTIKYTESDKYDELKHAYRAAGYANRKNGQSAGGSNEQGGGKPQLIGALDKVTDATAIAELAKHRQELAMLDNEVNVSVTADGRVWRTEGTTGGVHPEQLEDMGVSLKGSYSLHNHPASVINFSFSADDVGFFFGNKQSYSEAFDHVYRYYMRHTAETISMTYDEAKKMFNKVYHEEAHRLSWEGKIDIDEEGYHVTVTELAERLKFEYGRALLD